MGLKLEKIRQLENAAAAMNWIFVTEGKNPKLDGQWTFSFLAQPPSLIWADRRAQAAATAAMGQDIKLI